MLQRRCSNDEVLNQDAKDHGLENDAYFKNIDYGEMLEIDEKFMKGQIPKDDISSMSSSDRNR